jgi:hypothetical protein
MAQSASGTKSERQRKAVKVFMELTSEQDNRLLGLIDEMTRKRKFRTYFREAVDLIYALRDPERRYVQWLIDYLDLHFAWLIRAIEDRARQRWEEERASDQFNQLMAAISQVQQGTPAASRAIEVAPRTQESLVKLTSNRVSGDEVASNFKSSMKGLVD